MTYTIKMRAGEIVRLGKARIEYRRELLKAMRQEFIDNMMRQEKKILWFGTGKYYTEAEAIALYEDDRDMGFWSYAEEDRWDYFTDPINGIGGLMKSAERCEPDFIIEVPGKLHRELTAPTDSQ